MKGFKIMMMILAALGVAGFAVSAASGDIYSWTDENGVRYFTNHAPPEGAELLIKTPEIPFDEEADLKRREMDRLEAVRLELAEREAELLRQQLEAERRLAAAEMRAAAALQEADRILQDAQTASQNTDTFRSSSSVHYYPYFRTGSSYLYGGYQRYDGGLYRKRHDHKYKRHHYKHGRQNKHHLKQRRQGNHYLKRSFHSHPNRHRIRSHYSITRGRYMSHQSRVARFRGRHGRY